MNANHDKAPEGQVSGALAPESAPPAHSTEIATAGGQRTVEVIETECLPPPAAGRQSAALRRGTAKQRVRGHETRRRLIDLHVHEGLRLKECAREMGISYGRALAVWHAVVAEVKGSKGSPEEHQRDVFAFLDLQYRRVIRESQGRIAEAASYGAAVIAACKALGDLHGLNEDRPATTAMGLEDVGREVRAVSPLLLARLDQIRELTGGGAGSGADVALDESTPGLSVGGVALEGTAEGTKVAPGATSPLLDDPATQQMIAKVMRAGNRAVRRAEFDGAEVALGSMQPVGIPKRQEPDPGSQA